MIVKNEEVCLEHAITSILPVADELVIVDTGSTDKTKQIAKKYTTNFFDFQWIDDFSAAYNFCAQQATQQYCLKWDADFSIDADSLANLGRAKKNNFTDANLIALHWIPETNGASRTTIMRDLIFKRSEFHYIFPIHDKIVPRTRSVVVKRAAYPDIYINHASKSDDKQYRYTQTAQMLKKAIKQYPKEPSLLFAKLEGELFAHDYQVAGKTAKSLLGLALSDEQRVLVIEKMVHALIARDQYTEAEQLLNSNTALVKRFARLQLCKADVTLMLSGAEAVEAYEAFLERSYQSDAVMSFI